MVSAAARHGDHWQWPDSGYTSHLLAMKLFILFWLHVSDSALLCGSRATTSCTVSAGWVFSASLQKLSARCSVGQCPLLVPPGVIWKSVRLPPYLNSIPKGCSKYKTLCLVQLAVYSAGFALDMAFPAEGLTCGPYSLPGSLGCEMPMKHLLLPFQKCARLDQGR